MRILINKFKEVSFSVIPITLLVVVLSFLLVPLEKDVFIRFIIGAVTVIIGLGIFLFGVELGVSPIGNYMGKDIAESNSSIYVPILGFILGFLITIAEPDLQILAAEVTSASGGLITSTMILIFVSVGVGIMVAVGLLRILYGKPLNKVFTIFYLGILFLGLSISEEFLAISVDASGATTGAMTTPFILALGYGVSQLKGGKNSEEDSFGMVGLSSVGPIFMVMILSRVLGVGTISGDPVPPAVITGTFMPFLQGLPTLLKESLITLLPLTAIFLAFNTFKFKLSKNHTKSVLFGLFYTFLGLTLFLLGVNTGFMEAGRILGYGIASMEQTWLLPAIGFLLGTVVVLAEPAVYVLTEQVEDVTSGHIKKKNILITLSIGIALAVTMSMLRIIIPGLKLWHFLLPGFALAALMSYFVPSIFVGIAYDSGGVASGPMTATFILAFAQGAADAIPTANVLTDGFGVIAMIAMMPIVSIQILGLLFKLQEKRKVKKI